MSLSVLQSSKSPPHRCVVVVVENIPLYMTGSSQSKAKLFCTSAEKGELVICVELVQISKVQLALQTYCKYRLL